MQRWTSAAEEETRELGRSLAAALAPDGILLLSGDLGSGKTVLAQGVGEGLGIDRGQIQSPSFTLIRVHEGVGGRLIHVDLYRLGPDELAGVGVDELWDEPGVKVVEWAERLVDPPRGARRLELRIELDGRRTVVETGGGNGSTGPIEPRTEEAR